MQIYFTCSLRNYEHAFGFYVFVNINTTTGHVRYFIVSNEINLSS